MLELVLSLHTEPARVVNAQSGPLSAARGFRFRKWWRLLHNDLEVARSAERFDPCRLDADAEQAHPLFSHAAHADS